MTMSSQIQNIYKDAEIIKEHQKKILVLKSTVPEVKISLEELNRRWELAEKRICEFVD